MNSLKKMKVSALLLAILLLLNILSGCAPTKINQVGETYSFTDSAGRTVDIPVDIQRIAPAGKLAQIVLFSIAPEKFVGFTSTWSKSAKKFIDMKDYEELPVFGSVYGGSADLNVEEIAAANPQIIIDIGEEKDTIKEDLDSIQEQLGIPVIHINGDLDKFDECFETLGKLLNKEEKGNELATYCRDVYGRTLDIMEQIPVAERTNILYCLGDKGLNVIGRDTYHSQHVNLLANNVADINDLISKGTGNEVSMEQILLWEPEVVLFEQKDAYENAQKSDVWKQLKAVQEGEIYLVPFGPYNWLGFPPSVNRYLGLIWLSDLLYPDKFNYDLYEEVKTYYKLFYSHDLTQEEFNELTEHSLRETNV